MTAQLTKTERQAIEKLLAAAGGEKKRERGVPLAADIRRLALDHLDDRAIAAITGASVGSVTSVLSRMRRSLGTKFHRRDISKMGLLIDLPDALRGRLQVEAAKRGLGPNSLANVLLKELLRGNGVSKLLGDTEQI